MAHDKESWFETQSEQDEACLICRMVGVEELNGLLIEKNRARFFEGNAMLFDIGLFLPGIPFEP